jgi:hypothetical protein
MAGNRTRINCLEGNYADHYTTIAQCTFSDLKGISGVQGDHTYTYTYTYIAGLLYVHIF